MLEVIISTEEMVNNRNFDANFSEFIKISRSMNLLFLTGHFVSIGIGYFLYMHAHRSVGFVNWMTNGEIYLLLNVLFALIGLYVFLYSHKYSLKLNRSIKSNIDKSHIKVIDVLNRIFISTIIFMVEFVAILLIVLFVELPLL